MHAYQKDRLTCSDMREALTRLEQEVAVAPPPVVAAKFASLGGPGDWATGVTDHRPGNVKGN